MLKPAGGSCADNPVRHRSLRACLCADERYRETWQRFNQQRDDFVRPALAGAVQRQRARGTINPDPHSSLIRECHGQRSVGLLPSAPCFPSCRVCGRSLAQCARPSSLTLRFRALPGSTLASTMKRSIHCPFTLSTRAPWAKPRGGIQPTDFSLVLPRTQQKGRLCKSLLHLFKCCAPFGGDAVGDEVCKHVLLPEEIRTGVLGHRETGLAAPPPLRWGRSRWWRSGTPARWRSEPAAVVARGKTVAPAACHTDLSHPKVAGCAWELSWAGGRLSWARADCRSLLRSLRKHTDHTPTAALLWVRRGPQRPRHCVCSCGSLGVDLRSDSQ